MRILLTGLMSVHLGRLENGNIGNYYITEPTIRQLHRVFPEAEIVTTLQLTDEFCQREKITVLPLAFFYFWSKSDLDTCLRELGIAEVFNLTGKLAESTPYINEVMRSDLILDFSGEMWGDYAEPVGNGRFLTVLLKDRVAQLLKKPVVLLAGSQGPFEETAHLNGLISVVVKNFKAILNREPASINILRENDYDVSNVHSFTDVAFLFEPCEPAEIHDVLINDSIVANNRQTVGFILCGFNMLRGPYDAEPRADDEFFQFAEAVEFIVDKLNARVFLMSHQNGFVKDPAFKLINGRDYPYAKQLYELVKKRKKVNTDDVVLAKGPYTPKQTKAIIGQFDMFVSGRIHAFVAAVSQNVPTVIINRGHGGISHRNLGFARSVGMEEYIADPSSAADIKKKIKTCWDNREEIKKTLLNRIPVVQATARKMFDVLKDIMEKEENKA